MASKQQLYLALVGGLIGGAIAGGVLTPLLVNHGRGNGLPDSANALSAAKPQETDQQRVEKEKVIIKQADFTQAIGKAETSVATVQSFSQGRLLRAGSGIILTQDGLLATLNSIVPPEAKVYQVSLADQILKGKIIYRDRNTNLAILSVAASGLNVAKLSQDSPALGQNLVVLAKTFNFNQISSYVAQALVSYIDNTNETWGVGLAYDQMLYGGSLIDTDGAALGIIDFQGRRASLIKSQTLKDVLNSALTQSGIK